jgi:hypothetical protein
MYPFLNPKEHQIINYLPVIKLFKSKLKTVCKIEKENRKENRKEIREERKAYLDLPDAAAQQQPGRGSPGTAQGPAPNHSPTLARTPSLQINTRRGASSSSSPLGRIGARHRATTATSRVVVAVMDCQHTP